MILTCLGGAIYSDAAPVTSQAASRCIKNSEDCNNSADIKILGGTEPPLIINNLCYSYGHRPEPIPESPNKESSTTLLVEIVITRAAVKKFNSRSGFNLTTGSVWRSKYYFCRHGHRPNPELCHDRQTNGRHDCYFNSCLPQQQKNCQHRMYNTTTEASTRLGDLK